MADNNLPQEVNRPLGPGSIELQVTLIHRPTSRHINIKLSTIKDNEGILKAERQQQIVTSKATCIRLSDEFLVENRQARNEKHGHDAFKVMKGKTYN